MKNESKQTRKKYVKYFYHRNHFLYLIAVLSDILMIFGNLAISWLLQQILDAATGNDSAYTLFVLAIISFALFIINLLIGLMQYHSIPAFTTKAMQQFKDNIFHEVTQKSYSAFCKENTSVYISFLSNDVASIESNYLLSSFSLIICAISFFGALLMMLSYSPMLTVIAILLSSLPAIVSVVTGSKLAIAEKQVSEKNACYIATLKDCLIGFSVIKSFKAEEQAKTLLADINHNVENAKCKRQKLNTAIQTVAGVAGVAAQLGVFLIGAWLAGSSSTISVGVVVVFVNLMNYIIQPITEIPGLIANRKAACTLIDRMVSELSSNVREQGVNIGKVLQQEITLKDVSFEYEKGHSILSEINLSFESGKSYAIVGTSGSGKSTLLSLLMGAQGDYQGDIYFDGIELKDINTTSLYELVSIIQQNVFIFNATIRDNVTMFREFPQKEVECAIQLSGLSYLIAERGEDYLCGENGCALSGGEKQRISIARSLLHKSSVLLVDEATAALDSKTAFQVVNAILDIKGLTKIIVTHTIDERIMQRFDEIITFKAGKVIERDRFDRLMDKKGYFYSLYTVSR